MIKKMYCICGVTCTGKDSLVERAHVLYPNIVGKIQIGNEMRRRHPPEYFKGLGAMQDTEPEVWEIFDEQYKRAEGEGKSIIFVSGVPRLEGQIERLQQYVFDFHVWFLTVEDKILQERLYNRFKDKPDWAKLAQDRLRNDKIQLYDVLMQCQSETDVRVIYSNGVIDHVIHEAVHG